jgi:hypothetical protein
MDISTQQHAQAALFPEISLIYIKQEAELAPEPVWNFWRREKSLSS